MDPIEGLFHGLSLAVTPELLLAAFMGALLGTVIGVLPGLGPVAGAALILPVTFLYDPAVGLIMIAGIYLGSQFGGSTAAILLNIPAEESAIVSTFDGYPMAKNGRAGAALAIKAVGSFISGCLALVVFVAAAPFVARFAMNFGAAEYFALTAGGLLVLARVTGGSLGSGLFPMIIGIALSTVGVDAASSYSRFTFGNIDLSLGFALAAVAFGLYGVSEIMFMLSDPDGNRRPEAIRLRQLFPTKREWQRSIAPWMRGSPIGFIIGLLPVPSAMLSTFISYRVEKMVAKDKKKFGKGAVEGLAGPEAANNSAAIGSMVPVMVLGLPFSATLVMMLAAMVVHGIQPGPLMMTQHQDLFWSVIGALIIANVIMLILNLPLIGIWVKVLQTPRYLLIPIIIILGMIGTYSLNNNMIDIRIMLALGIIGYILRALKFSIPSMLVGLVLGGLIENYFVRGMLVGHGQLSYFISTPISATIWAIVLLVLLGGGIARIFQWTRTRSEPKPAEETSPSINA